MPVKKLAITDEAIEKWRKAVSANNLPQIKELLKTYGKELASLKIIRYPPILTSVKGCAAHRAAGTGNLEILKILIKCYPKCVNLRDSFRRTPLHLAAYNGYYDIVKLLLDNGAEIDAESSKGKTTPLHYACKMGQKRVVQLLVERGANDAKENQLSWTPAQIADRYNYTDCSKAIAKSRRVSSTHGCSAEQSTQSSSTSATGSEILENSTTVDKADLPEEAANEWKLAMEGEDLDKIEALLVKYESEVVSLEVFLYDPFFEVFDGYALQRATLYDQIDTVKVLLQYNKSAIHLKDDFGRNALHIAAMEGRAKVTKLLLQNGAVINETTVRSKNTALHYACQYGHAEVARILAQHGADDTMENITHQRPCQLAKKFNFESCVKAVMDNYCYKPQQIAGDDEPNAETSSALYGRNCDNSREVLEQSTLLNQDSLKVLKRNCKPFHFEVQNEENHTFYEAVEITEKDKSAMVLQTELLQFMLARPTLQTLQGTIDVSQNVSSDWPTYCQSFSDNTSVSGIAMVYMAHMLNKNMHIVFSDQSRPTSETLKTILVNTERVTPICLGMHGESFEILSEKVEDSLSRTSNRTQSKHTDNEAESNVFDNSWEIIYPCSNGESDKKEFQAESDMVVNQSHERDLDQAVMQWILYDHFTSNRQTPDTATGNKVFGECNPQNKVWYTSSSLNNDGRAERFKSNSHRRNRESRSLASSHPACNISVSSSASLSQGVLL